KPARAFLVAEDDRVLPGVEHEVEVAPDEWFLRPPAIDHAPFLAHDCNVVAVHEPRHAGARGLDERRSRRIQSSRGTNSARDSGIRDQGATSTTVLTEPEPVL